MTGDKQEIQEPREWQGDDPDIWVDGLKSLRTVIERSPSSVWEDPWVRHWSAEVARILAIYANLNLFTLQHHPERGGTTR